MARNRSDANGPWLNMTPLQEAVLARVRLDRFRGRNDDGRPSQVTFAIANRSAGAASFEWARALSAARAFGLKEREVTAAANRMVELNRDTLAVLDEADGPISRAPRSLQIKFLQAQTAAVSYAVSLGFTIGEGELLATMR